ncbi:TPA: ATP synthase F1 subunit gamma [Candidatus Poribacteria bacterium]|nr:ATP synthase F1 subunit gamma [Candidatus Poribacteria bacterium]HEX29757.1 ATP synthase F1 subunit gamma [Candidatus Poribacteria bacterium]
MPSLKDIRKRIASVKSTQQITKAMKMVAAAKLRRAQEGITQARPYADKMREVIGSLSVRVEQNHHPLLVRREVKKREILMTTSDRGLCGGYNQNVIREVTRLLKETEEGVEVQLNIIGRKGLDYFKRRDYPIRKEYRNILGDIDYKVAAEVGKDIVAAYESEEFDELVMVYNHFRSAISQVVTVQKLLPIEPIPVPGDAVITEYIYEPSEKAILNQLLPRYVEVQIFRAMLEALASEYGARMTAMESATNNASEMIDRLTLDMNRARQAAITKELMEIVGGAEALK